MGAARIALLGLACLRTAVKWQLSSSCRCVHWLASCLQLIRLTHPSGKRFRHCSHKSSKEPSPNVSDPAALACCLRLRPPPQVRVLAPGSAEAPLQGHRSLLKRRLGEGRFHPIRLRRASHTRQSAGYRTCLREERFTFHGLRASSCEKLREAGCNDREISSITGMSPTMITRNCRFADRRRLAKAAMGRLEGRTPSEH